MVYSISLYDRDFEDNYIPYTFRTYGTNLNAIAKTVARMKLYKMPCASIAYKAFNKNYQIEITQSKEEKHLYKWEIWRIRDDGIFYIIDKNYGYDYDLVEYGYIEPHKYIKKEKKQNGQNIKL